MNPDCLAIKQPVQNLLSVQTDSRADRSGTNQDHNPLAAFDLQQNPEASPLFVWFLAFDSLCLAFLWEATPCVHVTAWGGDCMLQSDPHSTAVLSPLRRRVQRPTIRLHLRSLRPSLLDWRFKGDAWIVDLGHGMLAVSLGEYELARINGSTLDLPSLNRLLGHLWNRRPRRNS